MQRAIQEAGARGDRSMLLEVFSRRAAAALTFWNLDLLDFARSHRWQTLHALMRMQWVRPRVPTR
jgi:hypothetical protein